SHKGEWTLTAHRPSPEAVRTAAAHLDRLAPPTPAPAPRAGNIPRTAGSTAGVSRAALRTAGTLRTVGRAAPAVGLIIEGGHRTWQAVEIERQYREGQISDETRVHEHARNVAGSVGGMAGGVAGATYLGAAGAAAGAALGPVGASAGGVVGVVA